MKHATRDGDRVEVGTLDASNHLKPSLMFRAQHLANSLVIGISSRISSELFRRIAKRSVSILGKFFPKSGVAVRTFDDGAVFAVPLSDGYWSGLQVRRGNYESDITRVLIPLVRDRRSVFLDGGSNRAYFPCRLTPYDCRVVAIEAADHLADWIQRNETLNGADFNLIRKALWNKSGDTLSFATHPRLHAGGTLSRVANSVRDRSAENGWWMREVETITVDDALVPVQDQLQDSATLLMIKLDVEGAELAALQGATAALDRELTVVLYEQHATDRNPATFNFFEERGWSQLLLEHDAVIQLPDFESLTRHLETSRRRGFNILAYNPKSDFAEILSECGVQPGEG